jgi:hypothetical protein
LFEAVSEQTAEAKVCIFDEGSDMRICVGGREETTTRTEISLGVLIAKNIHTVTKSMINGGGGAVYASKNLTERNMANISDYLWITLKNRF